MRAAPLAARKMKGAARLYTEIHELESLLYQNLGFFSGLLVAFKSMGQSGADSSSAAVVINTQS